MERMHFDMKTGLVSITFRKLKVEEIIALVTKAKLDAIEWGSDIHVPDEKTARRVKKMCEENGILTPSYGSYYRCGITEEDFECTAAAAAELESRVIRVWAGDISSKEADSSAREKIVLSARKAAEKAREYKMDIAFEFHNGTLTDYADSALKLIEEIGYENVGLYWQPLNMHSDEINLENLKMVLPKLRNIHAFGNQSATVPMKESENFWKTCYEILKENGVTDEEHTAYLEFVMNGSEEQFFEDAECLKRYLA